MEDSGLKIVKLTNTDDEHSFPQAFGDVASKLSPLFIYGTWNDVVCLCHSGRPCVSRQLSHIQRHNTHTHTHTHFLSVLPPSSFPRLPCCYSRVDTAASETQACSLSLSRCRFEMVSCVQSIIKLSKEECIPFT